MGPPKNILLHDHTWHVWINFSEIGGPRGSISFADNQLSHYLVDKFYIVSTLPQNGSHLEGFSHKLSLIHGGILPDKLLLMVTLANL